MSANGPTPEPRMRPIWARKPRACCGMPARSFSIMDDLWRGGSLSSRLPPPQVPLAEALRQQFGYGQSLLETVRAADMDRRLRLGELGDALAAAAAGADQFRPAGDDDDRTDLLCSAEHH